ncbi:MAG: hypothetical protein JSR79_12060 [Proteobacteria bacterium]|nr:hypothetical protein [Pseudomonadota bacterium]
MSKVERDCLRVLRASASAHSIRLRATLTECRPWASVLFAGHRMNVAIAGDDDDRLDNWLIALPEIELAWRGHFVASAEVIERWARAAALELLVVEA